MKLTERYCVVLQTLRAAPKIEARLERRKVSLMTTSMREGPPRATARAVAAMTAARLAVVGPLGRHAHRGGERLEVDRRADDLHADEAAGDGVGVAEPLRATFCSTP